jgi:hypothetical protein
MISNSRIAREAKVPEFRKQGSKVCKRTILTLHYPLFRIICKYKLIMKIVWQLIAMYITKTKLLKASVAGEQEQFKESHPLLEKLNSLTKIKNSGRQELFVKDANIC